MPERDGSGKKSGWENLNAGLEFGATVLLFCLAGMWLDRRYGWWPAGTTVGSLLGIAAATICFLRRLL